MPLIACRLMIAAVGLAVVCTARAQFVHPGCLSTQSDLARMAGKVASGSQPWKGSWDILVGNTNGFLNSNPEAVATVIAGSSSLGSENYIRLARDCARAYQFALRYHGSGDTAFADKAVRILNAWASTHTAWSGDTNVSLRAGLYGYQFACAAELMRGYSGWQAADFAAFKSYMVARFHSANHYFLTQHHGTVDDHYWANWDLANMASLLAIGVLCDDRVIFDQGLNYFHNGVGNGSISQAVHFVHPNGMGQWQESGRDQGHSLMGPQLMGTICEIAWNQGIDLYGHLGNKFLSSVEYISKYNLFLEVPYVVHVRTHAHPGSVQEEINPVIASWSGRGAIRPGWDLVYNHYVNRRGGAAPFTRTYAQKARPEGGGFNNGTTSGGFDGLGFTTLTHSRDPIANGVTPNSLRPFVAGRQVTLSWAGSAHATSYHVKRSIVSGGPYTTLGTVDANNLSFIDPGLTAGLSYYYVVSANNPGGKSPDSAEATATTDGQLHGTVIGTSGSYQNNGAGRETIFDGSLDNHFDPPSTGAWVGLDLGPDVSAMITEVRYAPRKRFQSRMAGGKFQGSNTPDFSSGVVDLFSITNPPAEGVLTSQPVNNTGSFRYVRYINTVNWNNAAEVQFVGHISGLNAPSAPGGLTAKAAGTTRIDLSWEAVPGASSYNVRRTLTSGGPAVILENVTGTTFSDTGLVTGYSYFYTITALNSAGESPASSEAAVKSESGPITDGEVSGSVLALTSSGSALLTMDIAAPVAGHIYQIERSSDLSPQSWENFGEPAMGHGGPIHLELPIPPGEASGYYRIRISR